jgi:hypothetical protein
MSDTEIKDGSSLLNESRSQLLQGNLGVALARAMDSSDMGNADASILVALMYFSATGIQRNLEQASFYAKRYIEFEPDGHQKILAESIIDGTIGTENAKRLIFGSKEPYSQAYANGECVAKNKFLSPVTIVAISIVILLITFGGGYYYLQPAKVEVEKPVSGGQVKDDVPAKDSKKNGDSGVYEFKSGDVSVTVTPDGQRIIKSGDLEIRTPKD